MLDIERKYLESHRDELLRLYGGRYLVIKGEEITGAYDSMNDALQGAALKHGLDDVLIRRPSDIQMEISVPALTLGILNANISRPDSGSSNRG
jgi:hypothetical protein